MSEHMMNRSGDGSEDAASSQGASTLQDLPVLQGVTVYLVGAGPGDPELATIKARRCLESADVVIYDYLSNEGLLSFAPTDAESIFVGKKGFSKHVTQDEINALIVDKAREMSAAAEGDGRHRSVVRLKGGDPFVFGRGGEEALALSAEHIPFAVVPGVTSGIAAPACAGIPVTHRKVSSSVAFITGNEDPTKPETAIDWDDLAHGADTLCFYMGIRNLRRIASSLVGAGKPETTPVALVRWGTTQRQQTLTGTLADIADKAEAASFAAPAIIVVGDVVRLRDDISWFENRPLFGLKVAVTRSREQASALSCRLSELGAEVIECPTIEIEALEDTSAIDDAIEHMEDYDWAVLTSANGVEHLFERLLANGRDARALNGVRIAAIGPATARALEDHGIVADVVPAAYRAEAVADAIIAQGTGKGSRVLIARAEKAREVLPEMLADAGAQVDVVPVYRTVAASGPATRLALGRIIAHEVDAITFTSSSTVTNLMDLLAKELADAGDSSDPADVLADLALYSIGPVTSDTARGRGLTMTAQADEYTIGGLVQTILDHRATV